MASVTQVIKNTTQPRGGYIKPSQFTAYEYDDGLTLNELENVHSSIVGMAVDYLTRFVMGAEKEEAFKISRRGAVNAYLASYRLPFDIICSPKERADELLSKINGLDNESIFNACKMVCYDVWYRNPIQAKKSALELAKKLDLVFYLDSEIMPNEETIKNIKIMVDRSIAFWNEYGPIVKDGFDFKPNGYTSTVSAGDGDYLTKDTLWDFKVSKFKPTSKHTLQLLMYWIMGKHSGQEIYKSIAKLGIFNPRLNTAYLLKISDISPAIIEAVEKNIICY